MAISKSNRKIMIYSALILVVLFVFALVRDMSEPISLDEAKKLISQKAVTKAILSEESIYLYTKKKRFRVPATLLSSDDLEGVVVDTNAGSAFFNKWFLIFITILAIFAIYYFYFKSEKNLLGASRKSHVNNEEEESGSVVATTSDILFRDVAGIDDVKQELMELIGFLKDPTRYGRFGVRMPRGLLLIGPPGVGKTMIAKAVAGEAGVPFYYQSASSFVQIYVGMGAKRVRELFAEAKRNAPSIIFIDEIDAVGKMRGMSGRNDERDATLNQLLTEMDGFDSSSGVVVIAATNKIDVLDDALLRAGRFDRRVFVELPTLNEREAIIAKYLEKIPNAIDALEVAKMCVGFNGASLATLINEAALKALREDKILVSMDDVQAVKQRVKEGKKPLQMLSSVQKMQQAHYQTARAVIAYLNRVSFEKCTLSSDDIVYEQVSYASMHDLMGELRFYLSGMAFMHLQYQEHFSNVDADLKRAKKLAATMVKRFGMGENIMGDSEDEQRLLDKAFNEVTTLLTKYEPQIKVLAVLLQQREVLGFDEISEAMDDVL